MTTPHTSHRDAGPPSTPPGRRPDESMTLLISMMERPLDPGYAAAAAQREAAGLPPSTGTRTMTVAVAAVVAGLLLTLGALALRTPSTSAIRAKANLVSQIESRRAEVDRQEAQLRAVQAEVDRLQAQALGQDETSLQTRLAALTLASGAEKVSGPGITVVLDNAPGSDGTSADGNPRTDADKDEGKVFSKDLQVVVNGLWEAGAEAIAVNGQRLTSRSAIRFAGEAILVNYRPLARPYRISVIGDPEDLQVEFAANDGGAYARALQDNYGIRVSIDAAKSLSLPAATSLTVREAMVPKPKSSAPATTATTTPSTTQSTTPSTSESSP
ncbi:DUF881 domain-containing protein [Phycicoccus sp. Soil803]|uniref:DUF881 domain-containing protein n=1 Tax=Phycicoccus sp. Soil803 TaxID=1736415 RepID=UPI00070B0F2C|nr:DUF881 domain-containing protein [Phycicoccus sp. Soil803]KRF25015.1 hypothetical protein ASG95_11260 [Phycicoccus sp. Soil803]